MLCALSAAPPAKGQLLRFHGNVVINDEVYRAFLDLPETAQATAATAALAQRRVLDLLRRAGYSLATVEAYVQGDHVVVEIDEGRLDKVLILGEGAFQTLRFKLSLSLPANVFNQPLLDAQLQELAERHQLQHIRWELAAVLPVDHVGPQIDRIDNLGALEALPLITPGRPYELRIFVENPVWDAGVAPELRFDTFEGLALGLRWRELGLLLAGDRVEARGRVAGTLRGSLDDDSVSPVMSRAFLEGRWYTPKILREELRSFLWARADVMDRQRADLGLESFFFLPLELSLNLELTLVRQAALAVGGGLTHRRVLTIDRSTTLPVDPVVDMTPAHETRPFVNMSLSFTFNLDELRRDRRHELSLAARVLPSLDDARSSTVRFDFAYQKMIPLGWHEVWLRARAAIVSGEVLFFDELALGSDFLRGPFGDEDYVRKIGGAGGELRFSIARDLVKISLFNDLAAFGRVDHVTGAEPVEIADAFGVGLHLLVLDAFQLDAYLGVGINGSGRLDQGIVVRIDQAF